VRVVRRRHRHFEGRLLVASDQREQTEKRESPHESPIDKPESCNVSQAGGWGHFCLTAHEWFDDARRGWTTILDVLDQVLPGDASTCGAGLAQHAAVPRRIAVYLSELSETRGFTGKCWR
jgi:hypothetical protein